MEYFQFMLFFHQQFLFFVQYLPSPVLKNKHQDPDHKDQHHNIDQYEEEGCFHFPIINDKAKKVYIRQFNTICRIQ